MTTARQLIGDGACSAGCIAAATDATRCQCPCSGTWHGLVADADLTGLLAAWNEPPRRLTDLQIVTEAT